MAKFEEALGTILKHEGGFVDHPADPGGATNYGVSLRYLRSLGDVVGDFDDDGDVDAEDIRKMSEEDARGIYRQRWWDRYKYGLITDQRLATKVFDMAVNMGARQAHRLLQRALNSLRVRTGGPALLVDGDLGPKTLATANAAPANLLHGELQKRQAEFYGSLVRARPSRAAFLKGWLNRAYDA